MMVLTTAIHAVGMAYGLRWLKFMDDSRSHLTTLVSRSFVVGVLVLIMFLTTLIEAAV